MFVARAWFAALFLFSSIVLANDPINEIEPFNGLGQTGRTQIEAGQVISKANTSMAFARGLAIESCFLVALPAGQTALLIQSWNPSFHANSQITKHLAFKEPAGARFEELRLEPDNSEMRRLTRLTVEAKPGDTPLQLSLHDLSLPRSSSPDVLKQFWTQVLGGRLQRFQQGGLAGLPGYDAGETGFNVAAEFSSLLAEMPALGNRFGRLLKDSRLLKGAPEASTYYWDLSNVNGTANLSLGAIMAKQVDQHWQLIDTVFYASADFLVAIVFYELWPMVIEGKEQTLVWRTDLTSAPALAGAMGLKREIGAKIMLHDVQIAIRLFQMDAKRQGGVK